ncbi:MULTISPECIES: exodeoxyribonuclease V subunit gamma [unclassified Rubrivivax]|uniref:exodeoxyribonuclease V subunit gamma n=1 Tax=unclassified Rubrivivax TaxID=2649762 RepID=UPI001E43553B|nr:MULTISPECIES: exodeoxyribonuclease V subunit gamma [unclassified Rubrivivax]MCC9595238.1 exodeoxyribonuclease V subunit gamma [Rubrivivax sp. JA1055]MCC9647969.1 exodeoxyribonuclease V subunit gamma [Rubrivivax sp. JA1029]
MLSLHFSNRFEALATLLGAHLAAPREDLFVADEIVVPSAAVRRRLTLEFAQVEGVCAHLRFDYLAQWLWRQIAGVVPGIDAERSPFAPEVLAWRVWRALGDREGVAAHPRLAGYLAQADEVMRWELAERIAATVEQYVTYRPEWLAEWLAGRPVAFPGGAAPADAGWQAELWRRIVAETGVSGRHPIEGFIDTLSRPGGAERAREAGLPARVHVVALPTMPPLHARLLAALGRAIEVEVYLLNPCREYWFELVDPRRLAWLQAAGRDAGHEVGNRLLAGWGKQTQAQIDGLLDAAGDAVVDEHLFIQPPEHTLLGRLQTAILDSVELEAGSAADLAGERSIEFHVAHSRTRELEALHDRLLALFAADPTLTPADVLVVTPDLEATAPLVDAVFGTVPAERRIPYAVTGRARSGQDPAARALLALLSLTSSRVAASELFALLQQPAVARRFGLDEAALERLHGWLLASGLHWGLDAAHRAGFDLPAETRHTLADALDRLFLGHALPAGAESPLPGLLPAGDAEGSAAATLGAFWRYAEALRWLQAESVRPRPAAAWARLLHAALDRFVAPAGDEQPALRELRATIARLADDVASGAGAATVLPLAVLRRALEARLDDPARGGVPSGAVTFSAMSSLRGLPYRVVCAIGLDDGAFPTTARPPEFDLIALAPRRGDRQRRHDERNVLLDLLLAAREHLHLSWRGRSVRDNAPLPPSVLVAELLELLAAATAEDPDEPASVAAARKRLVVEHPLQSFAPELFDAGADARRRSHDAELAAALRAGAVAAALPPVAASAEDDDEEEELQAASDPALPFFTTPLPPPGPEWRTPTLQQLVEFFRQPTRYWLRRRLQLALQFDEAALDDDEPLVADALARRAFADRLLPPLLAGVDAETAWRRAEAGTELPSGAIGQQQMQAEFARVAAFADRVRDALAEPVLDAQGAELDFELDGEHWTVAAGFADLRASGLVRWRWGVLRGADLLEAWLQHLVLAAAAPAGVAARTRWLLTNGELVLRAPEAPREHLATLLRLYRRGLAEPLRLYPKTSLALVRDGAAAALKCWTPGERTPFAEGGDESIRLAWRGREAEALAGDFEPVAQAVFGPLLAHAEGSALQ